MDKKKTFNEKDFEYKINLKYSENLYKKSLSKKSRLLLIMASIFL